MWIRSIWATYPARISAIRGKKYIVLISLCSFVSSLFKVLG